MAGYFGTVTAKLDLDISAVEQGLARSTASIEKVGGALEHRLLGPRHLATAFATAFGLNIEKIGEHFASLWTGVTEQTKKYYEELTELSDKNTDSTIENMRKLVSEEHRYLLLLKERERILNNPNRGEPRGPGAGEDALKFIMDKIPLLQGVLSPGYFAIKAAPHHVHAGHVCHVCHRE